MRKGLYPRLAAVNMRKNRQTYLPYLFTCIGTAMMFYIIVTLTFDPALQNMSGGTMLSATLGFGCIIIGIFSVILVFYANSFIIKQRKREFGLYNILGMNKRNIGRILAWETVYTALISFVAGIGLGILFSKLLQLVLLKILHFDVRFGLNVSVFAIGITALLFAGIFVLTLLNSLRIIHLSKPVELLHGTQEGEREPKSKWLLAILGVICLGTGYTMSIMTKSAMDAISLFFIAVIFVIAGTYLLFTAFSIVFLKRLRANKNYYYKTRHFATVSGMLYRMKKNAGGLASICILSTMVLVTVSTTVSLYAGMDEMLETIYPYEINISEYTAIAPQQREKLKGELMQTASEQKRTVTNMQDYLCLSFATKRSDSSFGPARSGGEIGQSISTFNIVSVDTYNAMTGQNISLSDGQALLYTPNYTKHAYIGNNLKLLGREYKTDILTSYPITTNSTNLGYEVYCLVVKDETELKAIETAEKAEYGERAADICYAVNFNIDGTNEEKVACSQALQKTLSNTTDGAHHYSFGSRAENLSEFVGIYGGLFFLGLFLGFVFLMATVLIIYYKQVTEGYDDRERFHIMQNVGMTKAEVKKTIHSQVLIVFFLPLAATILHVAFAFPMIRRILSLFQLNNLSLFVICTLCAIGVFAALYTLVYTLTARTYYKIVS